MGQRFTTSRVTQRLSVCETGQVPRSRHEGVGKQGSRNGLGALRASCSRVRSGLRENMAAFWTESLGKTRIARLGTAATLPGVRITSRNNHEGRTGKSGAETEVKAPAELRELLTLIAHTAPKLLVAPPPQGVVPRGSGERSSILWYGPTWQPMHIHCGEKLCRLVIASFLKWSATTAKNLALSRE